MITLRFSHNLLRKYKLSEFFRTYFSLHFFLGAVLDSKDHSIENAINTGIQVANVILTTRNKLSVPLLKSEIIWIKKDKFFRAADTGKLYLWKKNKKLWIFTLTNLRNLALSSGNVVSAINLSMVEQTSLFQTSFIIFPSHTIYILKKFWSQRFESNLQEVRRGFDMVCWKFAKTAKLQCGSSH